MGGHSGTPGTSGDEVAPRGLSAEANSTAFADDCACVVGVNSSMSHSMVIDVDVAATTNGTPGLTKALKTKEKKDEQQSATMRW